MLQTASLDLPTLFDRTQYPTWKPSCVSCPKDFELLRGVRLNYTLAKGGHVWRHSPVPGLVWQIVRMFCKFEMVVDDDTCCMMLPLPFSVSAFDGLFRALWRCNSERSSMICHNQHLTWMCLWVTVGPQVAGGKSFHSSSRVHGMYCLYHGLWWCWSLLCLL